MRLPKPATSALLSVLIAGGLVPRAAAQFAQQGTLTPANGPGLGASVAVSADGSTAIIGSPLDNSQKGTASIFVRTNGAWSQQGGKLAPNDAPNIGHFGSSVSLSGDGSVAIIGGSGDNMGNGGAWIFTRSNGLWTQQGAKLFGAGYGGIPGEGSSVAMSADGNTALIGAAGDNYDTGAVWVFARSGSGWTQQGPKLVGTGAVSPFVSQGSALAISADGNTFIVGANGDNNSTGAAWIFTRTASSWSQQGTKLVGTGAAAAANQSFSVAISADGNTVILGRPLDNQGAGAAWVFTRSGGVWSQQGDKLTGAGAVGTPQQGTSVALSGDGNLAVLGGPDDNGLRGSAWVFKRSGNAWAQQGNKLAGASGGFHGSSMALSLDGSTLVVCGSPDAWVFSGPLSVTPAPALVVPASGSASTQVFTFNFSDSGGWQALTVLDVLMNSVLDGRQACYVAIVPSGPNSGSVYLVDDQGDAGGPYSAMLLPGSQTVSNGQCTIAGAGSSVAAAGANLTLTLAITFAPGFAGNKVLYTSAQDARSNSGWQALGTWNIPGPPPAGPSVTGLTNAGAYTFTFSDTNSWQDISVANVLIAGAIDGVGACYLAFVPATANSGSLYLVDDAGDAAGPYAGLALPGAGSISNSQCSISGSGSSVTAAGNTLTLTLAVTFSPTFAGNCIIYAAAVGHTQNSGWQAVGTVAVQ